MTIAEKMARETMMSRIRQEAEYERVTSAQTGSFAVDIKARFVGGELDGLVVEHITLMAMKHKGYTPRWSAMAFHNHNLVNLSLEDQPIIEGYLSPMLDGGMLRYETQEVYDRLSN